jgi:GT2 family glycosyltransferase
MLSIIIPTFNNLKYLELCINSLQKNSFYKNEILLHINEGSDGTLEYAKNKNITFTHSPINDGLCIGCNKVSKKSKYDLILYSHDDMYFCPEWDRVLIEEVNKLNDNKFYLSSIMINGDPKAKGHINYYAGDTVDNFDEKKLLDNYKNLQHYDFQGSTWAPHLIHKDLWEKVGGFSEEFSPGFGSDPDLNMKLWKEGVRIFKCLSNSKVYHFGSITIRKNNKSSFKNNLGSRANKIFLLKWKISISTFKKYFLKSDTPYEEKLIEPKLNFLFCLDLMKDKIKYLYLYLIKILNV